MADRTPQSAINRWGAPPAPDDPPATPMLDAVRADIDRLDVDAVPGGRTYQATALWLARVIDKRGDDEGPSTTAKIADQLTRVMQLLTRKGGESDDGGFQEFTDALSQPTKGE